MSKKMVSLTELMQKNASSGSEYMQKSIAEQQKSPVNTVQDINYNIMPWINNPGANSSQLSREEQQDIISQTYLPNKFRARESYTGSGSGTKTLSDMLRENNVPQTNKREPVQPKTTQLSTEPFSLQSGSDMLQGIEQRRLSGLNVSDTQAELEAKQKELENMQTLHNQSLFSNMGREFRQNTGESVEKLQFEVDKLQKDISNAQNMQAQQGYAQLQNQPNFETAAQAGREIVDPSSQNVVPSMFGYNVPTQQEPKPYTTDKNMSDTEQDIYYYLLETQGEQAANQYVSSIQESLNYREGMAQAEFLNDPTLNPIADFALTGAYGVASGLDQFAGGIKQLGYKEALPTSTLAFGSGQVSEDLGQSGPNIPFINRTPGQVAFDVTKTGANMAPSILLASLSGGLGASTGISSAIGSATLGASAGGNAYNQALQEGMSYTQARNYGALIGASESTLQYLIGGVGSLSATKGLSTGVTNKIAAIDSATKRVALNIGLDMAQEGFEEGLQTVLDPVFKTLVADVPFEPAKFEEVAYSAILGSLMGAGFSLAPTINQEMNRQQQPPQAQQQPTQPLQTTPNFATDMNVGGIQPTLDQQRQTQAQESVQQATTKLGENGANVISQNFTQYQDPNEYVQEMEVAYEAGRQNTQEFNPDSFETITAVQAQRAFEAGRADIGVETAPQVETPVQEVTPVESTTPSTINDAEAIEILRTYMGIEPTAETTAPQNEAVERDIDTPLGLKNIPSQKIPTGRALPQAEMTDAQILDAIRADMGLEPLNAPEPRQAEPITRDTDIPPGIKKITPQRIPTGRQTTVEIPSQQVANDGKQIATQSQEAINKSKTILEWERISDAKARLKAEAQEKALIDHKPNRTYNRMLKKWMANEWVNVMGDPQAEADFAKFAKKWYNAGANGVKTIDVPKNDYDLDFAGFLSDEFYNIGKAERAKQLEAQAKEEVKPDAKTTMAELPDTTGVYQPDTTGDITSEVLDGVPTEDVTIDEGTGDTVSDLEVGGRAPTGFTDGIDATGDTTGRSVGDSQGGDISASSGGIETETTVDAEISQEVEEISTEPVKAETTEEQIEIKEELGNQELPKGSNFVISDKTAKFPTTPKTRFNANVKAIKTLNNIVAESRNATPQEQEILNQYTGFGGIGEVFTENKEGWTKEYKALKALLPEADYKAAKASMLDAYYTEPSLIQGMYNGLKALGFTGGRMLEPSAGVGRFLGAMPDDLSTNVSSWTAVELDKTTGNIAKYLYPNANVMVQGFETTNLPDNYMDVVIGNVPFGNFGIADKAYPKSVTGLVHNYFIAKSLDKVREGGIAAIITSSGTMDSGTSAARQEFMKKADLIGAIRLPNTAFKGTGTPVVTDILVFKKRKEGTKYNGEAFEKTEYGSIKGTYTQVNEYYKSHPDMVLGTWEATSSRYGGSSLTVVPKSGSLQKQIEKAFSKIKTKIDYPAVQSPEVAIREMRKADKKGKEGGIVEKDGKLFKIDNGNLIEATGIKKNDTQKMSDVIKVRDTARELLNLQLENASDSDINTARQQLNTAYDTFTSKYGNLNSKTNKSLVGLDADAPFILSLENYNKDTGKATKADIFTKNTITPNVTVSSVETVDEALTVSMNETATVSLERMSELTGQPVDSIRAELSDRGMIFKNRQGAYETAEQYLSGNVRAKLRDAEALTSIDKEYEKNVAALKEIIPEDIPAEEIKVRIGATWIPDNVYSEFASKMLGSNFIKNRSGVQIEYNRSLGKFFVKVNDAYLKNRPDNTTTWGTEQRPFIGRYGVLESILNNKAVTVYIENKDGSKVVNKDATEAAQEKVKNVLAEFQRWLWEDGTRRTELGAMYNDVFNNLVTPKYNGENLTVNGMNPALSLRPHQSNAVQRIINSGGNTLLAHRVGAGKTFEMAAAAMKLRQLGIVKKPMFTVPKHLTAQWGNEFLSYFPAAKILVLGEKDFDPSNRKIFANKIATGDYDAVIMSYEQFKMIPMSAARQEQFYQQQIDALEMAIRESKAEKGNNISEREMERSKKSFEAKIKKLGQTKKDENNIDFEQMGIDSLFVDEAHNFKNLFYSTKMQRVADLGDKTGAGHSFDLYSKVQYLQELNGGRGIVFATATPVMNSVVELYTMQRYLQSDMLEAKGLSNFDAWANQFGDVITIRKMKTGGDGYEFRQSLSKYKNMQELQQMFRSFADVITDPADLPYLKIPKMKGGKRIVVEAEPSQFQLDYMKQLGERAKKIRGAGKGKGEDHVFNILDDGKKISFTQRMIDSSLPYEPNGKVMQVVNNVYDVYNKTNDNKGTQLIFADRGTPGGQEEIRGVALYKDIKNFLVGKGIPANEIEFIHDANKNEEKSALFKKVNNGDVRVLIGSTKKMGTGMNAQKRIAAVHELNAPDRPGDLEQNEGRALRQGNMYDEVEIYAYVTKQTFDSKQWDTLKRKAVFINQVMSGEYTGREANGDGDLAMSAAEISAIASDNPLIMEQFELSEKISTLESLERAHIKEQNKSREKIDQAKIEISADESYIKKVKQDIKKRIDTSGDKFSIKVANKTYVEREAGGEALIKAAKKVLNTNTPDGKAANVGEFAGFTLMLTDKGDIVLRGAGTYKGKVNFDSANGTIRGLENIPRKLEDNLQSAEIRLSENKAAIGKLESNLGKPFDKAEELRTTRKREAEVMEKLNPSAEQGLDLDGNAEVEADERPDTYAMRDTASSPDRWSADRVGSTDKTPMRIPEILEKIRRDFNINITKGHVRGAGVQGTYNTKNDGIRTRIANNLPTVSHELGHALDVRHGLLDNISKEPKKELLDNLDEKIKENYDEDVWPAEALAEYVRKFLQNRETTSIDYPEFTKYFLNGIGQTDTVLIEQLADEVNAYYSLDADTATSSIRLREDGSPDARTTAEKIKEQMSVMYDTFVDSNHGIKLLDEATGTNAYRLATNAAYSDAIAGNVILNDLTDADGNYVAPGLKTVLNGLNLKDKAEYKDFGEYLVVKHGPERLAEGMRIFADDRKNSTSFMNRRQKELEQQYPSFKEISERLYTFQEQFLRTWGVSTNLVAGKAATEMRERWEYYVPFNRVVGKKGGGSAKRGFANQTSTIKRAKGSGLDLVHPVDNIVNNIVKMVNAGVRNNVMHNITQQAQEHEVHALFMEKIPTPMKETKFSTAGVKSKLETFFGESALDAEGKEIAQEGVNQIDEFLSQFSRGKAHGDIVTVMHKGKPQFWKINDPLLLKSLTNMSPSNAKGILDVYGQVSRFMTMNLTGNNLIWSIFSNMPRDIATLFTYSKVKNPAKVFGAMGNAYLQVIKGDKASPLFKEFVALGGMNTSMYSADVNLAKKARKQLAGKKISLNPMDYIGFVADMMEKGPRFATYKLLRENGYNTQDAFFESMDVTVNFRRGGPISRELNKIVPFFNVSVQGIDKFFRWISASGYPPAEKAKVIRSRAIGYVTVSAALAALVYGMNHADEEKKKQYHQLSNFTKNSYFSIPLGEGKYFAIPKPREIAVLSSFMETAMEYGAGNLHAFDEFGDYAADNFIPALLGDVVKGDIANAIGSFGIIGVGSYMMANRDFLGRPIVSSSLENLESKDQYTDTTSKIAVAVGQAFGTSPQMVDYFFGATLGGFWKYQKALFPVGEENRDLSLGVMNSYVKDNQYSNDIVNWMYTKVDESTAAKNSNPTDMAKATEYKMDSNMSTFYSRYNALDKNTKETDASRAARQTVLNMLLEYQKADDLDYQTQAEKIVYSIVEKTGSTDYLPTTMQPYVKDGDDVTHALNAQNYITYQTEYLNYYWEGIENGITTDMSDEDKIAYLEAVHKNAKLQATESTLVRIKAPTTKFTTEFGDLEADTVNSFEAKRQLAYADGSLNQEEVIDIIYQMVRNEGLSSSEAYDLFKSEYTSDKNNPWA